MVKMVDTSEAMESKYLTADVVKNSLTKKCVVIDGGSYEDATFEGETSRRLTISVEIDGKKKQWRPNRDTVANLQPYGRDSNQWVGKTVRLQTIRVQGKDSIIGTVEA